MLRRCSFGRRLKYIFFVLLVTFFRFLLYTYVRLDTFKSSYREDAGRVPYDDIIMGDLNITGRVIPIWPSNDSDNTERICSQLTYAQAQASSFKVDFNSSTENLKFIYSTGILNKRVYSGREAFTIDNCPVNSCYLDVNGYNGRTDIQYDAYLTSGNGKNRHAVKLKSDAVVIWYQLESPLWYKSCPEEGINWTATYRRQSTLRAPYAHFVGKNHNLGTKLKNARNYAAGKTKMAAAFISNCKDKNGRLSYVRELELHLSLDVYGHCGKMRCPKARTNQCFQNLNDNYKFYLSFENSNCRDYITEKFFLNGLSNDVIPVVMGAHPDDYRAVAPPHSYIHVDDFESPQHLAEYMKMLDKNDTLYNEYFQWKGTGSFIDTKFWCRLCAMLHARDQTNYVHTYTDLRKWWRTDQCVSPEGPYGATWRTKSKNLTRVTNAPDSGPKDT